MKIALVNENSQAPKNALIFETLRGVAEPLGHTCYNYGRYSAEDPHKRSYIQAGILMAVLLNTGAADLVVTGCGTGVGAMLAGNSFPGVLCGYARDPVDAYLFAQINNGNAISIPFAKGFGWGGELNLEYLFEKWLCAPAGGGYPKELAEVERENKEILDRVKLVTHRPILPILRELDRELLRGAFAEETFPDLFFPNCRDGEIADYIKSIL